MKRSENENNTDMHQKMNTQNCYQKIIGLLTSLVKLISLWLFSILAPMTWAATPIHHHLDIDADLSRSTISVTDTIRLADDRSHFVFQLNPALTPVYNGQTLLAEQQDQRRALYRIPLAPNERQFVLKYSGQLPSTAQCQFTLEACSLFNQQGIFLSPSNTWYPMTTDMQTFDLQIKLPATWVSLSQGQEIQPNHWQSTTTQDVIYLLAGPFKRYHRPGKVADAYVYLLNDDPDLAERYLQTTHHYLEHYQSQLGDYPYQQFTTVESFWETGWGMPSFTLLGSRVMRFPFILHSSFPHEILHNWWGNSVYVDHSSGNWSEGLTAYLSDHLLKQPKQTDIAYRRTALDKYATFTQGGNDFPIRDFRSRHNAATQAIGYSKLLMVFHMLRKHLGDQQFFNSLQTFYKDYQFRYASMDDLIISLSNSSQQDLKPFFKQWIEQTDAPTITLKDKYIQDGKLNLKLSQHSSQAPFDLHLPIFAYADGQIIWQDTLHLNQAEQTFTITPPSHAKRIAIDPYFDVLRKPLPDEIPANLHAFRDPSSKAIQIIGKQAWWQALAEALPANPITTQATNADTLIQLGLTTPYVKQNLEVTADMYVIDGKSFKRSQHALVFADTLNEQTQSIVLDAPTATLANTVIKKLRHYGKYSYLLFDHNGQNVIKGEWSVNDSSLNIDLTQYSRPHENIIFK